MADLGLDQIHLADAALILLEGGDALGVRRPDEDGAIALGPAGIVGGVAEVLDAVRRELRLAIGVERANPEVVVADEGRLLAVGRTGFDAATGAAAPAAATSSTTST